MKLKLGIFLGLAIGALLSYAVAGYQASKRPADAAEPQSTTTPSLEDKAREDSPGMIIAASYSRKCATPKGTCKLDKPEKVGSRCTCPKKGNGKVVR